MPTTLFKYVVKEFLIFKIISKITPFLMSDEFLKEYGRCLRINIRTTSISHPEVCLFGQNIPTQSIDRKWFINLISLLKLG